MYMYMYMKGLQILVFYAEVGMCERTSSTKSELDISNIALYCSVKLSKILYNIMVLENYI